MIYDSLITKKAKSLRVLKQQVPISGDSLSKLKAHIPSNSLPQVSKPKLKKAIRSSFKTKGSISLIYEYGWLPFALSAKAPVGNYKTEGEVYFSALNFPLRLNFFYSDIKYNTGINNHFKISYDVNAYKEEIRKKAIAEQSALKDKVSNTLSQQQLTERKLLYMEQLKKQMEATKDINLKSDLNLNKDILDTKLPELKLPDTTGLKEKLTSQIPSASLPSTDSLKGVMENRVENKLENFKDSSMNNISESKSKMSEVVANYRNSYDSVNAQINKYKNEINQMKASVNEAKEKINKLEEVIKNPASISTFSNKKEKFMSGVKKLEFGLCYPSYSTFLVNNMPVKGVNIQYEKNDWFTAFTYGTTVNNLLFTPSPVQNILQNTKNLYNFFDFGNVEAGRRIIAGKTGFGTKEKTHLHLGFLYGLGANSYINSSESNRKVTGKERNTVVEVDAKYDVNTNHSFELIYGKSAIKDLTFLVEEYNNAVKQLTSGFRSNAVLVRYNGYFKKTKTKLTLTNRMIDPFFRSFGVAYMRSDNLRYEIKAEQPFNSKLKYSTSLRYDEDNLLSLYQYKTRMFTWGNNLQWKMTKRTTVRLAYNPVLQNIKTGEATITNKNSITNVVVSYIPKTKNISMQQTAVYSYYNLTTDSLRINFQNVMFSQQIQFRNGYRSALTSSWYKNNLSDSLNNNSIITVLEGGYTSKKGASISIAGKAALFKMKEFQSGFSVKAGFKLFKKFVMELQVDRIVTGEFYNTYNIQNGLSNFPYYGSAKLTYKW